MQAVAELDHVGLSIGKKRIYADLCLSVPATGCTVLMGPAGTGKSTLLRTLAGMAQQHPDFRLTGHIRVEGLDELGRPMRNGPVLVGQKADLLLSPVWESLVAMWTARSQYTRAEQLAFMQERLDALGQGDVMAMRDCAVLDLPLGIRRRIGIISKSLAPTSLLMIDEPTANLGEADCEALVTLIRSLAKTMPVLVVTHNQRHARSMADHVILVASGRVQEAASAQAFFEAPQSESARQFLRSGSCPEEPVGSGFADTGHADAFEDDDGFPDTQVQLRDFSGDDFEPTQPLPLPPAPPARAEIIPRPPISQTARLKLSPILGSESVPVAMPAATSPRGRGPRGFVWLLDGQLAGTPKPGIVGNTVIDLQDLRHAGITHLLSLTEVPFPPQLAKAQGLSCSALPMPDMEAPSIEDGKALCVWIDQLLQNQHSVAVHCKAGLGRTGTMLAMYFIWRGKGAINASAAITKIRSLNSGMIQSVSQETFLEQFTQHAMNELTERA